MLLSLLIEIVNRNFVFKRRAQVGDVIMSGHISQSRMEHRRRCCRIVSTRCAITVGIVDTDGGQHVPETIRQQQGKILLAGGNNGTEFTGQITGIIFADPL
jgi:hypothetical protein